MPAHTRAQLEFSEEFAAAAEWFAVTAAGADLRSAVPTCPGWTVYDLVTHLGNIHAWAATVVETGSVAPQQYDAPRARKAKVVAEWYAGKAEDLYEVLRHTTSDKPCWNFAFGNGTAAFWQRRQLHETTVHGMDLALARHWSPEVSPDIAGDGIDEALRVFGHRMHLRGHRADLRGPVTLLAADLGRAWTVRPSARGDEEVPQQAPAPPVVKDGPTEGADRVEGPAASLYALLWKRLPVTDAAITLTGDQTRIAAYLGSRLTP